MALLNLSSLPKILGICKFNQNFCDIWRALILVKILSNCKKISWFSNEAVLSTFIRSEIDKHAIAFLTYAYMYDQVPPGW